MGISFTFALFVLGYELLPLLLWPLQRAEEAGIKWDTEAHNPLLLRAVYGERPPKMILVAREPISRLYSAFHGYPHYNGKYGGLVAGCAGGL